MKRYAFLLIAYCLSANVLYGAPSQNNYPHWKLSEPAALQSLTKIDSFVEAHHEKSAAFFDFDGTLFREDIISAEYPDAGPRAFQSVWYFWNAFHLSEMPMVFPLLQVNGSSEARRDVILNEVGSLKALKGYSRYLRSASFMAGMTPKQVSESTRRFLQAYPPCDYVFYPVLDLMQRMKDAGLSVWIITGSNPYFVAAIIREIEKTCVYSKKSHYAFGLTSGTYLPEQDRIIGNATRLSSDGIFTLVYDDRFFKNSGTQEPLVSDEEGKRVIIEKYIEPIEKRNMVIGVGNSDGDFAAIDHILSKNTPAIPTHALGILVNPRGEKLLSLPKRFPADVVSIEVKLK